MANVNTDIVLLFDPDNEHTQFEKIYDRELFSRLSDKGRLVLRMLSRRSNPRSFNVFVPATDHEIVSTRVILFENAIFYIYCKDLEALGNMQTTYNYPMYVKLFEVKWLKTFLDQAFLTHLIEQTQRVQHEPDEFDIILQEAATIATNLADELTAHMNVQIGIQPED